MPNIEYFLGANSPQGFYSLYDQLIDLEQAGAVYILKGGPGCGKSTLMRRVGKAAQEAGLPVEYIICSGDPESLDGVVLPGLGAAVVDGTAPHVVEPKYPGVVERYVDLGACYDMGALAPMRGQIKACMSGYKGCYQRAYRCLSAAARIREDMRATLLTPRLEAKMEKRAAGILGREVRRRKDRGPGGVTQRFLSGITHRGIMTLYATAWQQCERIYELADSYGLAHTMLSYLLAGITAGGYDVVACPSPMFPERLEHLIVPELGLGFVSCSRSRELPGHPYRRIRLDAMIDSELMRSSRARLRFSARIADALTQEAVDSLAQAKGMHDELEGLYNPHVDFDRVKCTADEIIGQLIK